MNVALVIVSDRQDLYLPRALDSLAEHCNFPFASRFLIDDRDHKLGLAGAVNRAWSLLPADTEFVLHWEEDFVATVPVPVQGMVDLLVQFPRLCQVVLKRQPWSAEEKRAGGIIEQFPHDYTDHGGFVEHQRVFSLNPCVYPMWVTREGWPAGNEAEFTAWMVDRGFRMAFWGGRFDPPMVEHVGEQRGGGWRL